MFEVGSLVLLPFPFTDPTSSKFRPVLVLTNPDGYGDFIGMAVTSKQHHDNAIAIQNESLSQGQLPKPSWIRTDRVVSLNASLVIKKFAQTNVDIQRQAVNGLCEMLRAQVAKA